MKQNFEMSENTTLQIASQGASELTALEESYINKCVSEFGKGELKDCEDGCTLLMYLARKLNCETKKITDYFERKKSRSVGSLELYRPLHHLFIFIVASFVIIKKQVIPAFGEQKEETFRSRQRGECLIFHSVLIQTYNI